MKLRKMVSLIAIVASVIGCVCPVSVSATPRFDPDPDAAYYLETFSATGKSFDAAKAKVDAEVLKYYNDTAAPVGFTYSPSDMVYEKAKARFVKAHPYALPPLNHDEGGYGTVWVTDDGVIKYSADEAYWQKKGDDVSDSEFNPWTGSKIDGNANANYPYGRPSNWYHKDGNKKKPMGYYDVPDWFGWKDYLWTVKNVTYRDRPGKQKLKAKKDIYGYKVTVRFHKS